MTTFTTEDREFVELHIKSFPRPQECALTHPFCTNNQSEKEANNAKALIKYRIEDSSEDIAD